MPPKAGRGRGSQRRTQKRKAEETEDLESPARERRVRKYKKDVSPRQSIAPERSPERSPEGSPERPPEGSRVQRSRRRPQRSPPPPPPAPPPHRPLESSDDEDESPASPALPAGKSKSGSKSGPGVGKVDKGTGGARRESPAPGPPCSFTEEQEEAVARWMQSKKLLYNMKDKQYKDKALRRQLFEAKAAEYGMDYDSIQKWYHTQRTRFSKLREGRPTRRPPPRSGDDAHEEEEEEEASEHDSDRDKFVRRVFGFLRPHIRRHRKEAPAGLKERWALDEPGEPAGGDVSTRADAPREPTVVQKYTGYPTPTPPPVATTTAAAEDRPESPTVEMRVTGASRDLQDRLVQFITREQQVNRATPFCKYLETELDRLHDACLEPAYEEITTVLNHYRKVSRQLRTREEAGDRISPLEDVPSAFQSLRPQQQGPGTPRVRPLQPQSALPSEVRQNPACRETPPPRPAQEEAWTPGLQVKEEQEEEEEEEETWTPGLQVKEEQEEEEEEEEETWTPGLQVKEEQEGLWISPGGDGGQETKEEDVTQDPSSPGSVKTEDDDEEEEEEEVALPSLTDPPEAGRPTRGSEADIKPEPQPPSWASDQYETIEPDVKEEAGAESGAGGDSCPDLDSEMRTWTLVEFVEKLFHCPVCELKCVSIAHLRTHMRVHTGDRPYLCPDCGKAFTTKSGANRHIRSIHHGDRPFHCEFCSFTFTFKSALTRHLLVHTGERATPEPPAASAAESSPRSNAR